MTLDPDLESLSKRWVNAKDLTFQEKTKDFLITHKCKTN